MGLYGNPPVYFDALSAVTATAPADLVLGMKRVDTNGYKWVYAYNAGNSQINPTYGAIVVTGTTGYSVTLTSVADTTQNFAGVVVNATLTTAKF